MREVEVADALATRRLGRDLALLLPGTGSDGDPVILLLSGELGAGKTSLVQGLADGLGIEEAITSPTFALAHHYLRTGGGGLVHLDLYRLEEPGAADDLFAQEEEEARALGAVLAVEWPERLRVLPADAWRISLHLIDREDPEAGRTVRISLPPGC